MSLREQFATGSAGIARHLDCLRTRAGLGEVVLLSTCNRFELYGVCPGNPPPASEFCRLLLPGFEDRTGGWTQALSGCYLHSGVACVQHLFRVASSLDSLIVGETEIVGQVKRAYQQAHACGATGRVLNRLFQKALAVSKEVRTRSGIGRCPTSVGAVALDLAEKIYELDQATILIVGAGKMGETTLRHLAKRGAGRVLVANRSVDRARKLAAPFQGEAVALEDLDAALARADVVISSTSAPYQVIGRGAVEAALRSRGRPMVLIDLAIPRDVDPGVGETDGAYLYNLDQLEEIARINRERRQAESVLGERLIGDHAIAFGTLLDQLLRARRVAEPSRLCGTERSGETPLPLGWQPGMAGA